MERLMRKVTSSTTATKRAVCLRPGSHAALCWPPMGKELAKEIRRLERRIEQGRKKAADAMEEEAEAARSGWSAAADRRLQDAKEAAHSRGPTESILLPGASSLIRRHERSMWPLVEALARSVAAPRMPLDQEGISGASSSSSPAGRSRRAGTRGSGGGASAGAQGVQVMWAPSDQSARDAARKEQERGRERKGVTLQGLQSHALRLTLRMLLEYASESARATEKGMPRPKFGTWLVQVFLPLEIASATAQHRKDPRLTALQAAKEQTPQQVASGGERQAIRGDDLIDLADPAQVHLEAHVLWKTMCLYCAQVPTPASSGPRRVASDKRMTRWAGLIAGHGNPTGDAGAASGPSAAGSEEQLERLDARHATIRALELIGSMGGGDEVASGFVPSWEYSRFRMSLAAMRGLSMDRCLSGVDNAAEDAASVLRAAPKWLELTQPEVVGAVQPPAASTGLSSTSSTTGMDLPAGSLHANQITALIARYDRMRLISSEALLPGQEFPPPMAAGAAPGTSVESASGHASNESPESAADPGPSDAQGSDTSNRGAAEVPGTAAWRQQQKQRKRELHPTETIARNARQMVNQLGLQTAQSDRAVAFALDACLLALALDRRFAEASLAVVYAAPGACVWISRQAGIDATSTLLRNKTGASTAECGRFAQAMRGLACRPSTRPDELLMDPMGLEYALKQDEKRRAALIGALPISGSGDGGAGGRTHVPFGGDSSGARRQESLSDEPQFEFVSDRVDGQYEVRLDDLLGMSADAFCQRHARRRDGMLRAAGVLADYRLPAGPGAIPAGRWDRASMRLRLEGPRADESASALDGNAHPALSKQAFMRFASAVDSSVSAQQLEQLWQAALSHSSRERWRAARIEDPALEEARGHPAVAQMRAMWAQRWQAVEQQNHDREEQGL